MNLRRRPPEHRAIIPDPLGRFAASGVLLAAIVVLVLLLPQEAGRHPGEAGAAET